MPRDKKYLKKLKKDYQNKNLCNPFFHKQPKKTNKLFLALTLIGLFILFIFIIWFFLKAPIWRINDIRVEGLTNISETGIKNKVWEQTIKSRYGLFRQDNIWLFDEAEVEKNILTSYNLASLKIIKKPARTLLVKVGERPHAFIFQQGTDMFYASGDGYILREIVVSESDKLKYFILENKNSQDMINENNKINISEKYLSFIIGLANQIVVHSDLPFERFVIDAELDTIKVKFKDGPLVFFDTKTDAKAQVDRLVLVKKEKIKDNFSKTNYIDLRYGDRIFIN
jgi:cell division septal protein FtsQ